MSGQDKGVWQDMGLYWAWRNTPTGQPFHAPPTVKRRDYVQAGGMTICAGVWDNGVYTPLHRKEIERLNKMERMTLQKQLEQAEAQLKEIIANRPKMYRAWEDTWTTFHEDPAAFHKARDNLYRYDVEKNKVVDEVKRLKKLCI